MSLSGVSVAVASWFLALMFLDAWRHKIASLPRFKANLSAYRMVPKGMVGFAAGLLLLLEGLVGLALLGLERIGLIGAALLLALYMCAIVTNLRGRTEIDCGCGDIPTPLSYRLVLRNLMLAGAAVLAVTVDLRPDQLTWRAGTVAVAAALLAYGIYMSVEHLIANQGRLTRWHRGAA
jgi:hypothetical protein